MVNDYLNKIRDSERLTITLNLFKKGKLTLEQAKEMIATDVQFHKEEFAPVYQWHSQTASTTGAPYTWTTLPVGSGTGTVTFSNSGATSISTYDTITTV